MYFNPVVSSFASCLVGIEVEILVQRLASPAEVFHDFHQSLHSSNYLKSHNAVSFKIFSGLLFTNNTLIWCSIVLQTTISAVLTKQRTNKTYTVACFYSISLSWRTLVYGVNVMCYKGCIMYAWSVYVLDSVIQVRDKSDYTNTLQTK